jgi:hypothetical protein
MLSVTNSPDSQTSKQVQHMTPKKSVNSKSPLRCILKKSKRRECTPDSPVKFFTDQKSNRTIELLNNEKLINSEKKTFLTLIEESLNEVNDNYFGLLGSQTTPDSLFTSIFSEKISLKNSEDDPKLKSEANLAIKQIDELMDRSNCNGDVISYLYFSLKLY